MDNERVLIGELKDHLNKEVLIKGWISVRRDHGKIIFFDLRDRSNEVQVVVVPGSALYELKDKIKSETVIAIKGLVKERPEKMRADNQDLGTLEVEGISGQIYAEPVEPFQFGVNEDMGALKLETLLDNRALVLRNRKIKSIFKIYNTLLSAYDEYLRSQDFVEIKTPKIVGGATEGGSNVFTLDYFDKKAFLAQSPQFYKQIMAGVYERVFEIGPVFRAEHHYTSRHVNEYTSLDAEMAFIESEQDVMNLLEGLLAFVFGKVQEKNPKELAQFGIDVLPEIKKIPRIPLQDALNKIKDKFGKETEGLDIDPEGEKLVSEFVMEEYGSEFVFLTEYPVDVRPFYHLTYPDRPQVTRSFDLIYRGLELATGAQRINEYAMLVESMKSHGLNSENFQDYLLPFKFGMPPHGGWGMSGERIVQKMLGLKNIRETLLFPRDVKRLTP